MTKKDYELVASAIKEASVSEHCKKLIAIEMAERCRVEDIQFKGSLFFSDCGLGGIVCED
jgi:hypothetical protein